MNTYKIMIVGEACTESHFVNALLAHCTIDKDTGIYSIVLNINGQENKYVLWDFERNKIDPIASIAGVFIVIDAALPTLLRMETIAIWKNVLHRTVGPVPTIVVLNGSIGVEPFQALQDQLDARASRL